MKNIDALDAINVKSYDEEMKNEIENQCLFIQKEDIIPASEFIKACHKC